MAFEDKMRTLLNLVKVPTGTIIHVVGTDVPTGYLLCNGAAVSRTKYSSLFAKIGTKFGTGDGSTTFNLPNLEGRVLQATTNTSEAGKFLEASLPNITGGFGIVGYGGRWSVESTEGAFSSKEQRASLNVSPLENGEMKDTRVDFKASSISSTYNGSKLQPSALQLLACIRC